MSTENSGFFGKVSNMFGNLVGKNSSKNSSKNASVNKSKKVNGKQMTQSMSYGFTSSSQKGGVASIKNSIFGQPSEQIMQWATTAGSPTPTSGMRNVAHGGKRTTHKNTKVCKNKKSFKKRVLKRKTLVRHKKRN